MEDRSRSLFSCFVLFYSSLNILPPVEWHALGLLFLSGARSVTCHRKRDFQELHVPVNETKVCGIRDVLDGFALWWVDLCSSRTDLLLASSHQFVKTNFLASSNGGMLMIILNSCRSWSVWIVIVKKKIENTKKHIKKVTFKTQCCVGLVTYRGTWCDFSLTLFMFAYLFNLFSCLFIYFCYLIYWFLHYYNIPHWNYLYTLSIVFQ